MIDVVVRWDFNYNFVIYFYFLKDIILFESKNEKLKLIFIIFFVLFLYKFGVEKNIVWFVEND